MVGGLSYLQETPSQTAGPYVHIGLIPHQAGLDDIFAHPLGNDLTKPDTIGERIRIEGRVFDGLGDPCRDVMVEIWQANAAGRYNSPADRQELPLDPGFRGWGRTGTAFDTGLFTFETIKPGGVVGRHGQHPMAPHINVWLVSRGINIGLATRLYFAEERDANARDPVLGLIEPSRRHTLLAPREGHATYVFDIHLQGPNETVFFDI